MPITDVPACAVTRVSPRRMPTIFLALAAGLWGCDEGSVPATAPVVLAETPEDKLDRAMTRLQSALADAQAAASSGVISERTSDYRFFPPKESGGEYTAEVTIKTKIALANAPAAVTLPKPVSEEEPAPDEEELATADELVLEETPAPEDEADAQEEESDPDNGVTRKAIAQSMEHETDVYRLAYQGDRWTLLDEPKGETEKLIFEYALGK